MLFKVFPDLLACALQARADALEGNLFKISSWGSRITRY